jgi:DNA-binding CsgD family transcriptional regulator
MDLMQVNLRPGNLDPDLDNTIAAIYRSTENGTGWREVARQLANLFNADAVVLCHTDGETLRILGDGLYNISPDLAACLPLTPPTHAGLQAREYGHASRTVDDVAFARHIDSLPHGARVLTVVIPELDSAEPRAPAHLSVARAKGRLPFNHAQQNLRVLISQHLTEALRIQRRFARRQRTADFHSLAILHLGEAWLVVDREMALIDCNPLARSFLMRSPLMRLEAGVVRLRDPLAAATLQPAIDAAWAGEHAHLNLTRVEDGSQVGLDFHPFFSGDQRSSDEPEAIMVLVRELDRDLMLKIEAKAETSRLSRAERRVMVHLVRSGQPPAAIAAAIGTSERTVRCQLSSIFRKTGARNQQDLIRKTLMA